MNSTDEAGAVNSYGERDPFAGFNDGFLGTGHSSAAEASFIAIGLIAGYLAFAFGRYYWRRLGIGARLAEKLDL